MKAVVQRVSRASVTIDSTVKGSINKGYMILFCAEKDDTEKEVLFLVQKIYDMRIFTDDNDKMNLSLKDVNGDVLIVSQFTLAADCSHGRRPSFFNAKNPVDGEKLYNLFCDEFSKVLGSPVKTGEFGADMQVELINDGPVTIILDTKDIMK